MSQKIVITANMKKSLEATAPEVTYQWHWRRILVAALLVALTLVVVAYSLMGSVNAEQNDSSADNQFDSASSRELVEHEVEVIDGPLIPEQNTQIFASSNELQQPKAADIATQVAISDGSKPVQTDEQVSSTVQTKPETAQPDTTERSTDIASKNAQQENFSDNAHIASVALGAKIDTDKVSRAVLTREVVEREPINVLKADIRLSEFSETLTFFSELKNLQGQRIKHIWRYENQVMATIELDVTSPRYRTYSNKHIFPEQTGHWRVDVVDEQDHLLAQKEFRILAD